MININREMKNIDEIKAFVYSIELRDMYTQGHSERVGIYAREFVKFLKIDKAETVYIAGLLHDLGKIGIPDAVLLKPGKLEPDEFNIIKLHSVLSGDIVEKIPNFSELASIVRHHHEAFDGSGYPDGLKGEEIPFLARILTIVDVFDALTTKRVYRKEFTKKEAIEIMQKMKSKFDPELFEKFLEFIKHFDVIKEDLFKLEEGVEKVLKNNIFFIDLFTKTLNREGLLAIFRKSADYGFYGSLIEFNIKEFKNYNKLYGLTKGDELLKKLANSIKETFDAIGSLEEPHEKLSVLARTSADRFYMFYLGRRGEYLEYKLQKFCKSFDHNLEFKFLLKDKKLSNFKNEIGYLI